MSELTLKTMEIFSICKEAIFHWEKRNKKNKKKKKNKEKEKKSHCQKKEVHPSLIGRSQITKLVNQDHEIGEIYVFAAKRIRFGNGQHREQYSRTMRS